MPFEIDHLFICVSPGAPETERILSLGLVEGSPNVHPGQGTANRRIFFENAYLEFLWVQNEREAQGEQVAPLKLWDRWKERDSDACPFGICLRASGQDEVAPFPAWEDRPPYLPDGLVIHVATNSARIEEPMLFCLPWAVRPDRYSQECEQPLAHPVGIREITAVRITIPGSTSPSDDLCAIERIGLVQVAYGPASLMEVAFNHEHQGRSVDLRPDLPLILRW